MDESISDESDTKNTVAHERTVFIFSSAAMVAALKDDETASKDALRSGGDPVRQRVLLATDRLRDWIAEMKE